MPGQVQALRRRVRTVTSTRKITRAQELVATSRIARSQERLSASMPYADAITNVLTALASKADIDHPLLKARPAVRRAGVLVITSDRGLAGAYNASVIRTCEQLIARLKKDRKEVALYVVGRKGTAYYRFRGRPIEASWAGFSGQPTFADARRIGESLLAAFVAGGEAPGQPGAVSSEKFGSEGLNGVDELHVVSTHFENLMTQSPVATFLAPLHVEEREAAPGHLPAYEFEPDPDELLATLLPKYVNTRVYAALLDAAASEWAIRRRTCKAATDNAEELITSLTRQMNTARQAEITQEISEIVGGANALAAAGSDL